MDSYQRASWNVVPQKKRKREAPKRLKEMIAVRGLSWASPSARFLTEDCVKVTVWPRPWPAWSFFSRKRSSSQKTVWAFPIMNVKKTNIIYSVILFLFSFHQSPKRHRTYHEQPSFPTSLGLSLSLTHTQTPGPTISDLESSEVVVNLGSRRPGPVGGEDKLSLGKGDPVGWSWILRSITLQHLNLPSK